METAFMNSEKNKTFDPYKLLLNLSEKINLNNYMLLYQVLPSTMHGKILEDHI